MLAIIRTRWQTRPLSCRAKRRSSAAPGSLRKKYAGILHPPNMVRLPINSTTSGDHRKPVLGLLAYDVGFAAILIGTAGVAGLAFGYDYGVVGPTAIAWGSAPYPRGEASRARPVALVTMCFNVGSIVTAQVTGAVLPAFGWPGLLLTLAALLMLTLLACAVPEIARRKHANLGGSSRHRPWV
jgi:MFS family permease